jgi:hypothetical protein
MNNKHSIGLQFGNSAVQNQINAKLIRTLEKDCSAHNNAGPLTVLKYSEFPFLKKNLSAI